MAKILSGVYPHGSYSGDVLYDGQERAFADISDSEAVGIIIIYQELALVSPNRRMGDSLKKPMTPRATDLPRIMTPEGNVLRVTARGASAEVVR